MSMAVLAVVGTAVPASASVSEEAVSVQSMSGVAAAADLELDFAVAGSLPARSRLTCNAYSKVEICYEKSGDKWWVRDNDADGASAGVLWRNVRNGANYRSGLCFSSLSAGAWGYCNKNYYEDSSLYGVPCTWNRSAGGDAVCPLPEKKYQ